MEALGGVSLLGSMNFEKGRIVVDGAMAFADDAAKAKLEELYGYVEPQTGKLLRYRGGAYAFWRDMLNGRFTRFPERVLVDANTTLGQLLGERGAK